MEFIDGVTVIEECRSIPFLGMIILIIIALLIGIVGIKVFNWFYDRDSVIGIYTITLKDSKGV